MGTNRTSARNRRRLFVDLGAASIALVIMTVAAYVLPAQASDGAPYYGHRSSIQGGVSGPTAGPARTPRISFSDIMQRATSWVTAFRNPPLGIPQYSQSNYFASPTNYWSNPNAPGQDPPVNTPAWREDCSGFVSYAWGVWTSYGGFTTFSVANYSNAISWDSLQPGDALYHNFSSTDGHMVLFAGWTSSAHTSYNLYEESYTDSPPRGGTQVVTNVSRGDPYWSQFTPIRYQYASTTSAPPAVGMDSTADSNGYWVAAADGGVFSFGDANFYGSMGGKRLNSPVVGMARDPATGGYWLVAYDGGVFSFNAPFYGSTGNLVLNRPVVGIAATNDGGGYWLVASDGGVFSFGDANFYGSMGGTRLNQPVVGMARDPATSGYRLVATDGGIFTFNAPFYGSTGNLVLNRPVVGMAADPATGGYWLVASDGGVFSFNASFFGSMGGTRLNQPVVGMSATRSGRGYWLTASDGGIFTLGDAGFFGSVLSVLP